MANITLNDLQDTLGSVSSADTAKSTDPLPTGIDLIDYNVCGIGGFPRGRFSSTFAKESAGKTTFWLYTAGELIRNQDALVCWVNAGEGFTWEYAQMCGAEPLHENEDGKVVGMELLENFTTGQDALYKIKQRLAMNIYDLIVVDSADKLVPENLEEAKSTKNSQYENMQAPKMYSEFVKSLDGFVIKNKDGKFIKNEKTYLQFDAEKGKMLERDDFHKLSDKITHLAFIQHALDDLQAMSPHATTTSGGRRIMFEAALRISIKLIQQKTDSKGNLEYKKVRIKPVKNKVFSKIPGGGELLLYPDGHIEAENDAFFVDIAVNKGLFKQSGAWFYYNGEDLEDLLSEGEDEIKFHGADSAMEWIEAHPGMKTKILEM